jgi:predicted AlkP superfamily phosphohydrolase/phosphomutase
VKRLDALRHPNGDAVCAKVYRSSDLFRGPRTSRAPDIAIDPADGYDFKAALSPGDVWGSSPISGMHTVHDAMFYLRGRSVPQRPLTILDASATVLSLLSLPVPPEFDGAPLS